MKVYHENQVPWPVERSVTQDRKSGPFRTNMIDAATRIEEAVSAFTKNGANWRTKELWIYADGDMGIKGRFLSNQRGIKDPRVAVTFDLDGEEYKIVADRYIEPWQNLAGIAEYIKAIRAQERNGIFTAKEMMATFAALPAPKARRPWYVVLEVSDQTPIEVVHAAYRTLAKKYHPDSPEGDHEKFVELAQAYETAKEIMEVSA